jgi:hypothetical protein
MVMIIESAPTAEAREAMIGRVVMDAGQAENAAKMQRLFGVMHANHLPLLEEMMQSLVAMFKD